MKKENEVIKAEGNTPAMPAKKSTYQIVVDQVTGIFLPLISVITGASILKSVVVLLCSAGLYSETSGFYQIFYGVSDGFFYFLPFFLALTASKQWKTDPFISLMIPVAMLYPEIVSIIEGESYVMTLFGITVPHTIYHSSVIPVLLAVGLLVFVEKPCDRYLPEAIKGFMKPILCCLVVLPLTFLVFGPIGSLIGAGLTRIFFLLYDFNTVIAGMFMGAVYQPMVIVGAHWSLVPVAMNNMMRDGYDLILPLLGAAVYGQGGAALAVGLMYKKEEKEKRRMAYQASLTAVLGVTEPALIGINLPLGRPVLAGCLAGAIGGGWIGIAGTQCSSFAFPSILTAVAYVGPGFVSFILSMVLGFILGFLFTWVQKKQITARLQ